jgi:RHS repeat-associated protein
VSISDDTGTQTFAYDTLTGDLMSVAASGIGTLSATYDSDGRPTTEQLPDGVVGTTTYDESGAPVALSYRQTQNCAPACGTLLDFSVASSIHDQQRTQASTLGSNTYTYDAAGRLSTVTDVAGGQCKQRQYGYDADSNRTSLLSIAPTLDGSCGSAIDGTLKQYSYDAADRITNSGFQYDAFGRTLTVPGTDAYGADLTATYYADDLAHSITQGGTTTTFGRDPNGRTRLRSIEGSPDEIQHYADDSATPSWTETTSGSWTRLITGVSGLLGAIQTGTSGGPMSTVFELTDLNGSVVGEVGSAAGSNQLLQTFQADEFGVPSSSTGAGKYAWLGGHRVSTETPSGVIAMGKRLYMPSLGRFLQTDPAPGGSANAYDYANQDPLNQTDLTGCGFRHIGRCLWHCIDRFCDVNVHKIVNCLSLHSLLRQAVCLAGLCHPLRLVKCGWDCIKDYWPRHGPPPPPEPAEHSIPWEIEHYYLPYLPFG